MFKPCNTLSIILSIAALTLGGCDEPLDSQSTDAAAIDFDAAEEDARSEEAPNGAVEPLILDDHPSLDDEVDEAKDDDAGEVDDAEEMVLSSGEPRQPQGLYQAPSGGCKICGHWFEECPVKGWCPKPD